MMHRAIQASLLGILVAAAGCSNKSDNSTGAGGAPVMCVTNITASDASNYQFQSTLTINVTKVQPSADLKFDWSGAKTDFLGHAIDTSKVGMLEVMLWNLTIDSFEKKLNDDALGQSDLSIIAAILPSPAGTTTGDVYQLTSMGYPLSKDKIDPYLDITKYPPDTHIYTAMVADGTDYGKGTRMIQGFQLDSTSTNTQVNVTTDSTKLALSTNMHSLTSPTVPTGTPGITLDWTNMMTTASGLMFEPTYITEIRVGKYSKTPTELEDPTNFLNLDTVADVMYTAPVTSGTTFDLSQTKDANGNPFPGIDDSHTWIVALNCTDTCSNPAPWYMTVLKSCTAK